VGLPRLSLNVFLIAFLPVLVAAGWVVIAHQPDANWFRSHVLSWSDDIGILGLVRDLTEYVAVLAFGVGLVFGFTFEHVRPGRVRPVRPAPARCLGARRGRGSAAEVDDRPTAREEREAEADREDEVVAREREPARTE